MKKVIIIIVLILLFLTGLSILLYPVVSDYVNSLSHARVISRFNQDLAKLSEEDYSGLLEAAREYNERLAKKPNRFYMNEDELAEYYSMLDFTGRGVIGTIEIPTIKAKLPIYLGTKESVLQVGLGHLEGSSLPIGGLGTHSVVSGHRGLPSSSLLTSADELEIGDVFILKILKETLVYEIDQIKKVDPGDFTYLGIDPEMDYCTLLTCTPYGINSHRLLLRGHRVFPEDDGEEQIIIGNNIILRSEARRLGIIAEYIIAAIPVLVVLMIYMVAKYIKTKVESKKSMKSKGRR